MKRIAFSSLLALLLPTAALAITSTALNGSVEVDAGGYAAYTVNVPPILPGKPRITAHVTAVGGAKNDIRVMVFTKAAFGMWELDHGMTPIYDSGKSSSVDIDLTLGHSGTYVIVLSNTFAPGQAKMVTGRVGLSWDPPYTMLLVIGALVAGIALSVRRKKDDDAEQPPQEMANAA
jgi:hypothetical protein